MVDDYSVTIMIQFIMSTKLVSSIIPMEKALVSVLFTFIVFYDAVAPIDHKV